MNHLVRTAAIVLFGLVASLDLAAQKLQSRTLFVEAVDGSGAPIPDLKPADLELTEGANKRQIVKIQPGTAPMRVAVLVDTGSQAEPIMGAVRSGLNAFLTAFTGTDEIALVAIGRQPRVLMKPTADRAKIKKGFDGIFQDGGPTVLIDGVRDSMSQVMKPAEVSWPMFVVISTSGTDASAIEPQEYGKFVDELRMRGATVHAIVIQTNTTGSAIEYAQNLAKSTGGSFETISAAGGVGDRLKLLAARITSDHQKMATRYSVEFLGDPKSGGELGLTVLRPGVKIAKMSNVRPF